MRTIMAFHFGMSYSNKTLNINLKLITSKTYNL